MELTRAEPAPASVPAREPRLDAGRAALLYLALSCLYFGKAFLPGRWLYGTDYLAGGHAFYEFSSDALRAGTLPSWVPAVFGGLPLFANPGSTFYPVHLISSLLLPTEKVLVVVLVAQLTLAGLGLYLLASEIGCRSWVAFVAGLLYQFTGVISSWVYAGHDGRIIVATLAPGVLWLLHLALRTGRMQAFAGFAAGLGLALLSFQIQNAWYLLAASSLWAAFLLYRARAALGRRGLGRRVALALGALALAFTLAAVNFLPFASYVAASPRGLEGGRGYAYSTSFSAAPGDLMGMAVPEQVGSSVTDPATGELLFPPYRGANPFKLHTEYVGAPALLLLGIGACYARRDPYFRFFAALAALFVSLALGGHTPLYRLYYAVLPGLSRFRAPDLAYYIVALSLSAMAAVTLERLASSRQTAGSFGRRAPFWWLVAAFLALTVLGALWSNAHPPSSSGTSVGSAARGWVRFGLFAAAASAALGLWLRRWVSARWALGLLALIATADLWLIGRRFFHLAPPFLVPSARTDGAAAGADDDVVRFLQAQPGPARTWVLPVPAPYLGGGNRLMHFGLQQAGGEHPVPLQRYLEYLGTSPRSLLDWHNVMSDLRVADTRDGPALGFETRPALLDAANIRFVVSQVPLAVETLRLVFRGQHGLVYENPGALPRAYLVPRVQPVLEKAASLAAVLSADWDPRQRAFVEGNNDLGVSQPSLQGDARVIRYLPHEVIVRTRADRRALLVLADNHYAGWRASIDGRPRPVLIANHTFRGVVVESGEHEVRFEFRPRALLLGAALSAGCWALLGGYGVWSWRRERGRLARRRPGGAR